MSKRYYLGHWVSDAEGFRPPSGVVGCIDFAPLAVQGAPAVDRPVGLFVTTAAVLPSEYALLAEGDCRELAATSAMQSAFQSLVGYRPNGDKLVDLIYDTLTDGSDPNGEDGPLPLVPGVSGWCDLHLGGHSRVLSAKLEWGRSCSRGRNHWGKIRTLLRKHFERHFSDAKSGKLKDAEHHRRVLDFWCDKYGLKGPEDWKELVPDRLQRDVPGRLKHETTITESWPTNSTTISTGQDLTWTETNGDLEVRGGRLGEVLEDGFGEARAESDLSGDDQYAKALAYDSGTANSGVRLLARFDPAARTYYAYARESGAQDFALQKRVTGTLTVLTTAAGAGPSDGTEVKCEINGSTLKGYDDGVEQLSITDTSITGYLRTGITARTNGEAESFEAADLAPAGGILYTQLERNIRGMTRGTWTGWNF